MKGRAGADIARRPQLSPVSFDDRPADRQTHAHTAGLGGEEGGEQLVAVRWVDPDAGVLNCDEHRISLPLRPHLELARPVGDARYAVHHQIDDDLVQLNADVKIGTRTLGHCPMTTRIAGHCHVNRKFADQMTLAVMVHAATVAWRHVSIA